MWLQTRFETYQLEVEQHFAEEEQDVAPTMRRIFAYKEYQ